MAQQSPTMAAWRHLDARIGFEVLFVRRANDYHQLEGHSTAVQDDEAWAIRYTLLVDENWVTRSAQVVERAAVGVHEVLLEGDGAGSWRLDGEDAPQLSGCLDVDLEGSACTNALPVLRLGLGVGERAEAPAAYVRAPTLAVERLEQSYERLQNDSHGHSRYDYAAPAFDFRTILVHDRFGFVLEYPGIANRVV